MSATTDVDSTARFSNRVDDYVKARPTYPTEVVEVLRQQLNFSPAEIIADIGAGTGISSRLFLENGNRVVAVEPNGPMRAAAIAGLAHYSRLLVVAATAEDTTLEPASVDLVVAAQAFHWFHRQKFAAECRRIGRADSHLLLMWNERLATGSAFAEGYERLLAHVGSDYTKVDHRRITLSQIAEVFPRPPQLIELPNQQVMDFDLLKARALSSSYVPPFADPRHKRFVAELEDLFDRTQIGGRVTMAYTTQLHLGRIHARYA